METTYWQRQGNKPLFSELEWDKPERRDQAGRLLIVGGNIHALTAPAKAYEQVRKTGIGEAKLMLPDKTKRLVGKNLPDAYFLPSTKSGELSQEAGHELLDYAAWADTLLFPGDNGRNSQTTILFEEILRVYQEEIVLTRDAVDILSQHPATLFERPNTTLAVSFAQLQKLIQNYNFPSALTFSMDLVKLIDFLHEFTLNNPVRIITLHQNQLICAVKGNVSTTKSASSEPAFRWRMHAASLAACYLTWYPEKSFEALTQSAYLTANQA